MAGGVSICGSSHHLLKGGGEKEQWPSWSLPGLGQLLQLKSHLFSLVIFMILIPPRILAVGARAFFLIPPRILAVGAHLFAFDSLSGNIMAQLGRQTIVSWLKSVKGDLFPYTPPPVNELAAHSIQATVAAGASSSFAASPLTGDGRFFTNP